MLEYFQQFKDNILQLVNRLTSVILDDLNNNVDLEARINAIERLYWVFFNFNNIKSLKLELDLDETENKLKILLHDLYDKLKLKMNEFFYSNKIIKFKEIGRICREMNRFEDLFYTDPKLDEIFKELNSKRNNMDEIYPLVEEFEKFGTPKLEEYIEDQENVNDYISLMKLKKIKDIIYRKLVEGRYNLKDKMIELNRKKSICYKDYCEIIEQFRDWEKIYGLNFFDDSTHFNNFRNEIKQGLKEFIEIHKKVIFEKFEDCDYKEFEEEYDNLIHIIGYY